MTEIEKAKAVWRICANVAIPLSGSDRAQIANSFKAMIELAEQAEGFEAFKREVSDAIELNWSGSNFGPPAHLARFILPKPKPDPLVEALNAVNPDVSHGEGDAELFRAALAKRGVEVREIEG